MTDIRRPKNIELLNKFKENVIQKFSDDLPPFSKKITMHSQARYAGVTLNDGTMKDRGTFMLQTINIQGNLCFMTLVVVI